MSYSYIKSVFPNYETSKTYDKSVYNSLDTAFQKNTVGYTLPSAYDEEDINRFAKNLLKNTSKPETEELQTKLIETYNNVSYDNNNVSYDYNEYKPIKVIPKDNIRYYNIPASNEYLQMNKNHLKDINIQTNSNTSTKTFQQKNIEHFDGQTPVVQESTNLTCDDYLKHTLECSKCKSILMKQFNLEYDRLRNEEIMEVLSYMIFGLFILLLIDNLSKK